MSRNDLQHLAVIDLGSNTTRLIVMAYRPRLTFKLVDEIRERVRLAEGMGPGDLLRPPAMERAVHTLEMFREFCRAHHVRRIIPVATSAVRDAANRAQFLRLVRERAGLKLRVLDGAAEARYAALGAVNSLAFADGFVVDIGGGSVQVAEVRGRRCVRSASLRLGTVRLTETFVHDDPVGRADYKALDGYIREALAELDWLKAGRGRQLVGLGGAIRNLAKIDRAARDYPLDLLHGYTLPASSVDEITDHLRRLPVPRRAAIPGLRPDRADVMLAGAMVLRQILRQSGYDELTVCGRGLREGLFFEVFLRGQRRPLLDDVRRFSVLSLARQYGFDARHAGHVARLALRLFDQLAGREGDGAAERDLLWAAAQLHDVGMAIDYHDHDQHAEYLLQANGLDGYTHREIACIILLVRYHRRGGLRLAPYEPLLARGDAGRLERLAAILRLAEYLERGRRQTVADVRCRWQGNTLHLRLRTTGDASVELWDAQRNLDLFERAFHCRVVVA